MDDGTRLIFFLDAYSPESIPMAKLADYMADFAALLGKENAVHFAGLEHGSTKIAARIGVQDVPKVTHRLQEIRRGTPPRDAARLYERIDDRLANDNAIGQILLESESGTAPVELLAFPGRTRPRPEGYGPFAHEGHLDGMLISVGGKDETISIRLQNGDMTYVNCDTTRIIARALARHLFEPVRIHGSGRWMREANGKWTLLRFRVHRFDVLDNLSLRDTVTALRAISGSGWKAQPDPLTELNDLRREPDELH